jgi:hypothetical protein
MAALDEAPDWLVRFAEFATDRHCVARACLMVSAVGALAVDGHSTHPQAMLERSRRPGRSAGALARTLEEFLVGEHLAFGLDQEARLTHGRRQRRVDATPEPFRSAVRAFAEHLVRSQERARRAGTRPRGADREISSVSITEVPQVWAGWCAWFEASSWCGGHLLVDEFVDGDGFVAVGAAASDADAAYEGAAVVASLRSEGPGAAGVALVDGDGPAGSGGGDGSGRVVVASSSVGGGFAGVGAVHAPPAGGEGSLADGAGDRDGIVTGRGLGIGGHDPATARRAASARAWWERIR